MANEFYALMGRMRYITRWGLMRNTFSENIQEHSHQVAVLAHALAMIGVSRRIIAFDNEGTYMVMFNPEIIKSSGEYDTEEGCLSLSGIRKTKRFQSIKVSYQNEKFQTRLKTFTGWTAQIIQHEIDHCNGILI